MRTAAPNSLPLATAAHRTWNFCAGPSMLPADVVVEIRAELPDYRGSGQSVMEINHRGPIFQGIAAETEADLRELMAIPPEYAVLFLHGGATLQYAMVPLNLAPNGSANYLVTGYWSERAVADARRVCRLRVAADGKSNGYTGIPSQSGWDLDPTGAYLHHTVNETIHGIEFQEPPAVGDMPLVGDMTSMILSRPVDVRRYGLIYASAQKNLGISGVTLVIVRRDLLREPPAGTPSMLDYRAHLDAGCLLNTPPVFAWYVAGKVLQWLKRQGGVPAIAERNRRKAELLYRQIDSSGFYVNRVDPGCRSLMNMPFRLKTPELDSLFVKEAEGAHLVNLAGHRSTGGIRASLYNAMPEEGVRALVDFMRDFERRHG
jgi:phosphoserine aminotransferase